MEQETNIQMQIDLKTYEEATAILEQIGLTLSEAVEIFLKQVIMRRGIPFQIKIPTD